MAAGHWFAASTAVNVGLSLFGGKKQADAERRQAELHNQAMDRQLEYDTQAWEMAKDKLAADRQYAVDQIMNQARNEGKIASYKDAQAQEQYKYALQIRNREQSSLNEQYKRSNILYDSQLNLNSSASKQASDSEINRHHDAIIKSVYDQRDAEIQALVNEGKMRATGASGRSAEKGVQVTLADYGRQLEMIDMTLDSSGRAARAGLEQISRDKTAADLAAYAQKMLAPGSLPMPLVPFATPMASYVLPRPLEEFDYGPAPVRGAMMDPSAAASRAWGTAIQSVAGAISSGMNAYTAHKYP
tara:strand:+ start:49 stop:951 length:903 start_codon:yes stop_codon:yes gene_type:complete